MAELFSNGASALLSANLLPGGTTLQVEAGKGALFPAPGGGDFARLVIEDVSGNFEIVLLTARTSDIFTITRAQEGTTALSFTSGLARVELRPTKGSMEAMLQKAGGTMTGALNLGGNNITNAVVQSPTVVGGQLRGSALRGSDNGTANEIVVPAGGGSPTVGGQTLYHAGNFSASTFFSAGMIMMWYGASNAVPAGWAICNGLNGTPDLRDRFVVGAGGTYGLSATGGALSSTVSTADGGGHTHTVGATALTVNQLPQHTHGIYAANNASNSNADGWGVASDMGIPGENVGPFGYRTTNGAGTNIIESVGQGDIHTHTLTTASDHSHSVTVSTLPPYYGLFFIMKVA